MVVVGLRVQERPIFMEHDICLRTLLLQATSSTTNMAECELMAGIPIGRRLCYDSDLCALGDRLHPLLIAEGLGPCKISHANWGAYAQCINY
eukprot:CAMPEP_0178433746 /NCGR_PEP_ID=MMETSP0689_2-20121128/33067_1 /TAXON_ID=160604 /ORGANISM="Amphidinium massartii, Strain CS-259" /LENGTH=91 /DNA_ID=CAMNT_0020055789 /DNA_START=334 /DNA_END=609 /DNA_ORIENTATION=+